MQFSKKLAKTAAIAIVLLMASVTLMATSVLPVQAQTSTNMRDNYAVPLPSGVTATENYETIAHMSFRPNPIGIGQPLLVNVWIQPPLHVVRGYKDEYLVTFTKPDGTKDTKTLTSYLGDATAWFEYTVDQVGTWKIKFDFLGGYFPAGNYTTPGSFSMGPMSAFLTQCTISPAPMDRTT